MEDISTTQLSCGKAPNHKHPGPVNMMQAAADNEPLHVRTVWSSWLVTNDCSYTTWQCHVHRHHVQDVFINFNASNAHVQTHHIKAACKSLSDQEGQLPIYSCMEARLCLPGLAIASRAAVVKPAASKCSSNQTPLGPAGPGKLHAASTCSAILRPKEDTVMHGHGQSAFPVCKPWA